MIIALGLSATFSMIFVSLTKLTGLGSEDAYALKFGDTSSINFQGLLLGGIIIGALGVLDDVTTSQSAAIFELHDVNPKLKFLSLFKRGINIGREHISSLVNTLVLAYAGAALPVFLFFILNPGGYPLWFTINSEFVSEEIVRTLIGSITLILAVPITTFLASFVASKKKL